MTEEIQGGQSAGIDTAQESTEGAAEHLVGEGVAEGAGKTLQPASRAHSNTPRLLERETFIEWLVTPEKDRQPKTQKELAGLMGVQPACLSRWKHEEALIAEVKRRNRGLLLPHVPDVMQAVVDKAKAEGDVSAAKLIWDKAFGEKDVAAVQVNQQINIAPERYAEESEVLVVSDVVKDE